MLTRVHIRNFKSISDLTLEPGRVNVLIGENGCGKSNFLEALAFASAAEDDKLDNEFLTSRGVRVTSPEFMFSAFTDTLNKNISLDVTHDDDLPIEIKASIEKDSHYPRWGQPEKSASMNELFKKMSASPGGLRSFLKSPDPTYISLLKALFEFPESRSQFLKFLIYSPENTALRTFAQEGQLLPLGIKGEGLFKLLRFLSSDAARWEELKSNLKMIDWFGDLKVAPEQVPFEQTLQIRDRFLTQDLAYFDQRSANEGFLFLLFYLSLMISPDTPSIFAIDNVDASLNPKTATALTSRLAKLAKKYEKQIFLTTHSPAVLDGIDLTDDEQRLFVFQRNRKGETRCQRITAPQPLAGEIPVKLSEAFLRGLIGGLPQNF